MGRSVAQVGKYVAVTSLILVAGCQRATEVPSAPTSTPAPTTEQAAAPSAAAASPSTKAAQTKRKAPATKSSTPTKKPKKAPQRVSALPRIYEVECGGNTGGGRWKYETFDSLEEAWNYTGSIPMTSCEVRIERGAEQPEVEKQAAELLGLSEREIIDAYGLCGAKDGFYTMDVRPMEGESADRSVREMRSMLALCPDFPKAAKVRSTLVEAELAIGQREAGDRVGDGTYVVGEGIQPGAWVVEKSHENCYWELLDNAGNIMDNNFVTASTRVAVTIAPAHYVFHTAGCGEWVRQS